MMLSNKCVHGGALETDFGAPVLGGGVLYALVDVSGRHRTRFVTRHSDDLVEQSEI